MKILIIANGYPDRHSLQWGCFERDQALALKAKGHDVSIMYIDRRFRTYWRKIGVSQFIKDGLAIYGMYLMPLGWIRDHVSYRLHRVFVTWMFHHLFKKYVRDHGTPDIIYAHYLYNIAFVAKLKVLYGIPLVGIEHWSALTQDTLSPMQRYWGNIAYHKADKILAVSQSLKEHIYRHFEKQSTVVYDMLGQEFVSTPIPTKTNDKIFRFVTVGSLLPIKCYDLLISAFAKFHATCPKCELVIVGDGPERQTLHRKAQELGLAYDIHLVGRKDKQEVIEHLSGSHVYVLSSRNETFGVACIEGLSIGLPCIATRCGGPEEFVNKKNGLLVPPNDVDALTTAMQTMYNHYMQYDSQAIAEDCRKRFSPQVIAQQLTDIFEEVITNHKHQK